MMLFQRFLSLVLTCLTHTHTLPWNNLAKICLQSHDAHKHNRKLCGSVWSALARSEEVFFFVFSFQFLTEFKRGVKCFRTSTLNYRITHWLCEVVCARVALKVVGKCVRNLLNLFGLS